MDFKKLFNFIPEVSKPEEKKLDFKTKFKWTLIILAAFFVLANIPLFGLSENALERFKYLAIILGTDFGAIISLGIGPIVMASIILQLLAGSGILQINQNTAEGRRFFQGIQKILTFFFIIFEALVYVLMGGFQALPGLESLLVIQLIIGGLAIFYMDEVVHKWGFGSGVSLFIGAGVSWRLVTSAFQFVDAQGRNCILDFAGTPCSGKVLVLLQSLINHSTNEFIVALSAILATVLIFLVVVWVQSLKVEIPLSFGRLRGYGMKWPLSFFYASVIPVILTAALIANIQLFGGIVENVAKPCLIEGGVCTTGAKIASWFGWLGHFSDGRAVSGLAFWMSSNPLLELALRHSLLPVHFLQALTNMLFFMFFSTIFAVFWVKTSNMGAQAQAERIASSGLQISGFRQDPRVLESILDRYVMPLTVMGGASIGLLASLSDLLGAVVSGTAMLLVIMITFQFYQNIAQQHMSEINPSIKKFMSG